MSYAQQVLRGTTRRLLIIQALLVLATAIVYLALKGWQPALAAVFGGVIAVFNMLVSAHRLARASNAAVADMKRGMMELYVGAIIRFVATPALFAAGIVSGLDPVAIIVGFAVAQVAYFFNSARPHTPNS